MTDLREALLELLGAAVGDEIAPGVRLIGVPLDRGFGYELEVRGEPITVEVRPDDPGRAAAARTPRLAISYRRAGGLDGERALALCRLVAARVAPREGAFLSSLATAGDGEPSRLREVTVEHLLEPMGEGADRILSLSPYVGCLIGCRFCYAQTRLAEQRALSRLPEAPWGSWVDVRVNAPEVLRRELALAPPLPIKLCPIVSDPYQAVEARHRVTRRCLETLRDHAPTRTVLVLTRATLLLRDLDVLAALPGAWVGVSIPTADDEVGRHFEPRAAPVAERLAMLGALRAAGVRTFAIVQPILPGDTARLAASLAAVTSSVRVDVLHGTFGAGADFADPRYAACVTDEWQRARAAALIEDLRSRGVALWTGELPPATVA